MTIRSPNTKIKYASFKAIIHNAKEGHKNYKNKMPASALN
jgi:hypothetical protein